MGDENNNEQPQGDPPQEQPPSAPPAQTPVTPAPAATAEATPPAAAAPAPATTPGKPDDGTWTNEQIWDVLLSEEGRGATQLMARNMSASEPAATQAPAAQQPNAPSGATQDEVADLTRRADEGDVEALQELYKVSKQQRATYQAKESAKVAARADIERELMQHPKILALPKAQQGALISAFITKGPSAILDVVMGETAPAPATTAEQATAAEANKATAEAQAGQGTPSLGGAAAPTEGGAPITFGTPVDEVLESALPSLP